MDTIQRAEREVLAALILDGERIVDARERLSVDHFGWAHTRHVFEGMCALDDLGLPVEPISLGDWMMRKYPGEDWAQHLLDLAREANSSAFLIHHAGIVFQASQLRQLREVCAETIEEAKDATPGQGSDVDDLVESVEQRVFALSEKRLAGASTVSIGSVLQEALDRVTSDQIVGLRTGLKSLDGILLGIRPSEFYVIAARPSVGKTTMALQITKNLAANDGKRVLFVSMEMDAVELSCRMIANESKVHGQRLRAGRLDEGERGAVYRAAESLRSMNLIYMDDSATTVARVRSIARRVRASGGLHLIVIDYLQLMTHPGEKDRVREVSKITRALKTLTRELKVPILAVAQLSRAADGVEPRLSHLRESGTIENDADVVVMLWPDLSTEAPNQAMVNGAVAKNRNGPLGEFQLSFRKHFFEMSDMDVWAGADVIEPGRADLR